MKNLPIYNIVLGDSEGLSAMSLVEYPAVESNFLAFSQQQEMKFSIQEEERIVFGCALRVDYPIYRVNPMLGEYYVVFSKEVVKQLYEKFFKDNLINNVNLEHDKYTTGVYLIQSMIKDTAKGISPVGFDDCEDGSWFVGYKVTNDEVWEEIKQGNFKGFSVELFCDLEMNIEKEDEDILEQILKEI